MLLNDKVKTVLQYLAWLVFFLAIAYFGLVMLVKNATQPYVKADAKVAKLVKQTSMSKVTKYYHLNRGTKSLSAAGKTASGKDAYFVYLPGTKKAYYYSASEGVSESTVKQNFQKKYPKKTVKEINLGWDKGQAVWEVTATNSDGSYCYAIYQFKDGKLLSLVDKL